MKTSRRNLLKTAAAGSVAAGLGLTIKPESVKSEADAHEKHQHPIVTGLFSSATVSFGAWRTDPPLSRFPNLNPIPPNQHQLIPFESVIKAGGTVNFIIGGFHHVLVYDDGTQPEDIRANMTVPPTNQPVPPLINDPNKRIYRGLDPSTQSQDRVEVVHFAKPGRYLVICGVQPHFVNDRMFAFVRVLPSD